MWCGRGNVRKERPIPRFDGVADELHGMVADSVGEVICGVVVSVFLLHTLVGHGVVVKLAEENITCSENNYVQSYVYN